MTEPIDPSTEPDRVGAKPTRLGVAITRTGLAAWSILGILVLLWAVIWVLGRVHVLVAPIVLAIAVIYLLNPVVSRLQARGVPRPISAVVALLGLVGLLVLLGWLVIPSVADQARGLGTDFPGLYEDTAAQIEDLIGATGFTVELWTYDELETFLTDPENQDQFLSAAFDRLGRLTSGVLEAILVFVVAPVIAFYLLLDLPRVRQETVLLIPPVYRDETVYVSREVGGVVGGFLRGQLFVASIVGVMMSFGFWLIGLDFWLIIGMTSGFLNIIPFVGPWVGGILGFSVGLVTDSVSTALLAGLVAIVVQQIDNHLVSPTVMRATVRLHPAVVVLVLILGGALDGIIGVLLAVPVTAGLKVVVGHLWRTRVLGQSWEEATEALIEHPAPPPPLRDRLRRAGEIIEDVVEGSADDHQPVTAAEPGKPGSGPPPG
ncbi:MAG: AI-2E family transporter [Acidimicrobiia bacterium]|nr:AI-2E family transporter [Acidimicrobiia bacterium]